MIEARHDDTGSEEITYRDGELNIEGIRISSIAAAVQTPFYCYSAAAIRKAYRALSDALQPVGASICFAVKANGNVSILALLAELGSGMDIVSGGELERALVAGVPASKIVFSGVGKKRAEIARALKVGVHQINVESHAELDAIIAVARSLGLRAPVALRVNPDVDARTHAKITTGKKGDKFGIPVEEIHALYAKAAASPELDIVGLAVHIGSQILDLSPYRAAFSRIADLVASLRSQNLAVRRLDLGGGLGIRYDQERGPDVNEYASIIRDTVGGIGCELTVEPGRWLVGPAGVLVTELLYIKETADRRIAIVDAGMNDLMRPALYGAVHPVFPARRETGSGSFAYQIVGPVCESSDSFGTYTNLPLLRSGDLLAFGCAGAYGASMTSIYNARDLPPEILVDENRFRVIRRRQTIEFLLALEVEERWQVPAPVAGAGPVAPSS